jgi:hypothetical protein
LRAGFGADKSVCETILFDLGLSTADFDCRLLTLGAVAVIKVHVMENRSMAYRLLL